MKQARQFVFERYSVQDKQKELSFYYRIDFKDGSRINFVERIMLPSDISLNMLDKHLLSVVLSNLHLILGVSYYKLWCPQRIVIENNFLTKGQSEFWNIVYTKGLGEFFYKNKIVYHELINFPYINYKPSEKQNQILDLLRAGGQDIVALVGIGGGKDSIVTAEMIKKTNIPFATWNLSYPLQQTISELIGTPSYSVKRVLDPVMISLSKTDKVFKGHIPASAIYAFISLLLARLYGFSYLIFGNERSSDYGSVSYLGEEINHQWSKSKEFEDLFCSYVRNYLDPEIQYFSLIRPFYEIEVVRQFCEYEKYFYLFSSCNKNFKIMNPQRDKRWCGKCSKCAFMFCLMSAFIPMKKVLEIFGANMFSNVNFIDTYRELLGVKDIKPFDCVGTPEEVKVAFYLIHEKGEYEDNPVMKMFEKEVLPKIDNINEMKNEVFSYGNDTNIPNEFKIS